MRHVLIIEDDPRIVSALCEIAIDAGATSVATADTPAGAMASALAQVPALILSDVNIVAGTGPEVVASIRQRLGEMPVIFVTGTPEGGASYAHASVILVKPVVRHLVHRAILDAWQNPRDPVA